MEFHEAKQKTEQLHKLLHETLESYQQNPTQIIELLAFKSKFHQYSVKNSVLIFKQNEHASFVASFSKWKKLGYSVTKGQKAIKILVPYKKSLFLKNGEWKPVLNATADEKAQIAAGKFETIEKLSFGTGSVFDISQTTCPVEDYPKVFHMGYNSLPHKECYNKLKDYIESIGIPVEETNLQSITLRGEYLAEENKILMNEKMNDTEKLSVLTHEFGHAVLHNDPMHFERPVEIVEFEADCFSLMLSNKFEVKITDLRKRHLANNFDLCKNLDFYNLEDSLIYVNSKYEQTIEALDRCITEVYKKEEKPQKMKSKIRSR